MKKAVGFAILSVLSLVAAWTLIELFANGFNLNMALQTMTEPVYLIVGGILTVIYAVHTYRETKKKEAAASAQ